MTNVEAKDILKDNNELEKKAGTLSPDEKWKLEAIRGDDNTIENAKNMELNILAKDGSQIKTKAIDLIKAIANGIPLMTTGSKTQINAYYINALENNKIMVNGKAIDNKQIGWGSELMALLQVAAWGNLAIDWQFWNSTAKAFSELLDNAPLKNASFEEVEIGEIAKHNFYAEFVSLYPNLGKTYMDTYKVFKAPNGRFTSCTYNNGDVIISYKSQFSSALQSIKISKIQKPNMNIDNLKLLKGMKDEVEKNEAKLEKINMQNTIQTWVNNLKSKLFTDYLMQRYLEASNKISAQGNIILNGKTSGMTVTWDSLLVDYWSVIGKKTYKLIDFWKNNKFDDKKMAATLTVAMKNPAIEWKKWQLTTTYKSLETKTNTGKNISVKTLKETEDILKWFQDLKKNLDFYTEVKLDVNMVNTIKVRIEQLTNQKNYLIAKDRIVDDLQKLEKSYNTTMTPAQYKKFNDTINGRVSLLEKWALKLIPSWVNVAKAFETAYRKSEFNGYQKRYKAMQQ